MRKFFRRLRNLEDLLVSIGQMLLVMSDDRATDKDWTNARSRLSVDLMYANRNPRRPAGNVG